MDAIDWRAESALFIQEEGGSRYVRLDRGRLSDMVNRALSCDINKRAKLFVQFADSAMTLGFNDMADLAQRPDFPIAI